MVSHRIRDLKRITKLYILLGHLVILMFRMSIQWCSRDFRMDRHYHHSMLLSRPMKHVIRLLKMSWIILTNLSRCIKAKLTVVKVISQEQPSEVSKKAQKDAAIPTRSTLWNLQIHLLLLRTILMRTTIALLRRI
jgi:hypothetical protein